MQWTERPRKKKIYPKDNEIRTVRRFLFMPLKIEGITKWLENASYRKQYRYGIGAIEWSTGRYSYYDYLGEWHLIRWID